MSNPTKKETMEKLKCSYARGEMSRAEFILVKAEVEKMPSDGMPEVS